jgi:transcriptional regulatory protein LEU3
VLRHRFHKVRTTLDTVPKLALTTFRTSCVEGIPPLAESFFDGDEQDREDMVPYLPSDLQFLHKVYVILMRAMVAMGKTNLQAINCDARVLRSLIGIFDSQLLSLAPSSPSDLGKSYQTHAKLQLTK